MTKKFRKMAQDFARLRVLVIGDAILDSYSIGSARRLCQEAPVPVIDDCRRHNYPGGAANVAANLRALGATPVLLSAIGCDHEGDLLQQELRSAGVETSGLVPVANRQTLTKHRLVCGSQILVRADQGTTSQIDKHLSVQLTEQLAAEFERCDAVIVSDYGYGVMTPSIIDRLAALQAAGPRVVAVDCKSHDRYGRVAVTLAKPNFRCAASILNLPETAIGDRAELILRQRNRLVALTGAEIVALTLDRDGVLVLGRDLPNHRIRVEAAPEAKTSGAGDTFISAMTLALAAGHPAIPAAEIATKAAAVVVEKPTTATCSIHELLRRLEPHRIASDLHDIARMARQYREAGRRIVLTNGCFDILHRGHITYLSQARQLGDVLIVGVNTDESIQRLKGPMRPVNSLEDRLGVLAGLSDVDHLVAFSENTPHRLIKAVRPDVFVKGGDYTRDTLPEAALVEELGGQIVFLPFVAARSTTGIIAKIRADQAPTFEPRTAEEGARDRAAMERCG